MIGEMFLIEVFAWVFLRISQGNLASGQKGLTIGAFRIPSMKIQPDAKTSMKILKRDPETPNNTYHR